MRNQIDNNVFGKIAPETMKKIEAKAIPCARIRLCATYLTPSHEIVPIAEMLVAYDTSAGQVVKFVAGFIPENSFGRHAGKKYLISRKNAQGRHNPVCVSKNDTPEGQKRFWNDHMLITHLDHEKLPWSCATAEYRVLRAYRADMRTRTRFELLAFDIPPTGDVDKRTMRVIWRGDEPPMAINKYVKGLYWWTQAILEELSAFSGVDLKHNLTIFKKVQSEETAEIAAEMLHDHSADDADQGTPETAPRYEQSQPIGSVMDEPEQVYEAPHPVVAAVGDDGDIEIDVVV